MTSVRYAAFSHGMLCPSCGSILRLELLVERCLVDRRSGLSYVAYTRCCPKCQIDPYPAYQPGDPLETE